MSEQSLQVKTSGDGGKKALAHKKAFLRLIVTAKVSPPCCNRLLRDGMTITDGRGFPTRVAGTAQGSVQLLLCHLIIHWVLFKLHQRCCFKKKSSAFKHTTQPLLGTNDVLQTSCDERGAASLDMPRDARWQQISCGDPFNNLHAVIYSKQCRRLRRVVISAIFICK